MVESDDGVVEHHRGVFWRQAGERRLEPFARVEAEIADRTADERRQFAVGLGKVLREMLPQFVDDRALDDTPRTGTDERISGEALAALD